MRPPEYIGLQALNWSRLVHLADSPAAYRHAADAEATQPTSAMSLGTLLHVALLEPDRLDDVLAVWPEGSTRTKAYKEWASEQEDAGRVVLAPHGRQKDAASVEALSAVPASVEAHDAARVLLSHGRPEVVLHWQETGDGWSRPCKGLADWLIDEPTPEQVEILDVPEGRPVLCDLKTTYDMGRLSTMIARRRYHGQLAHYARGVEAATGQMPSVLMLIVCTSPPYDVAVLRLDTTDALDAGLRLQASLLQRLAACEALDRWPGAHPGITELHLPAWADGAHADTEIA